MRRLALLLALAAGLGCLAATPLPAATVAGVDLPDSTRVGDQTLVLNGAALRSKLFFKVYVGGLYLPERRDGEGAIFAADTVRRMDMRFLRSVTAEQICDGWKEGLAANTPGASADLKARFDQLCGLMEDARDGTLLTLTYTPGEGTEIAFGDKVRGSVAGKDFADALLGCWIGPEPGPGADFKKGILGR